MKVSKSVLQAIAVAVTITATTSACTKEKVVAPKTEQHHSDFNCPACGRG